MAITFDIFNALENGAHFYTGDLHVHSFGGSDDVSDSTMTVTAIIDAAVKHKIAILAITDHNSSQNVAAALEYASKYKGQLLLVPGVELTTAHGHVLAYFAPSQHERIRDLLAAVKIAGKPGARDSHTSRSMADVIAETQQLGGICIAAHIDRQKTGFESIVDGYPAWKKDVVASTALCGLEFDDEKHLGWYSEHDEPTAQGAERRKIAKIRSESPETIARSGLAAVQNSDAHSLADFRKANQLTRYKMNQLTFDGLRTAFVDPGARVRAVARIPSRIPRVLGIHIEGGFLDSSTIRFSDNLNCFIGGRGTGKSTALRSVAYALGIDDDFAENDNCPDSITLYAEDENGARYRYTRIRGQECIVQAKEDNSITDVPADAFRVEFYGQGDLAEVARDPLRNPALLQEFLDRHIVVADLHNREREILQEIRENHTQLIPLETGSLLLPSKRKTHKEVATKIQIAEAGKLKEIAAMQSRLGAEKSLCESLDEVSRRYKNGFTLSSFKRNYQSLADAAGALTLDADSTVLLEHAKLLIEKANKIYDDTEAAANVQLATLADAMNKLLKKLALRHREMEQILSEKISDFQKQGLSGDLRGLNELIKQRATLTAEIGKVQNQQASLIQVRERRQQLLSDLTAVREELATRRKQQLNGINQNLRRTITDYSINLHYHASGMIDEFSRFVKDAMHGSYLQDQTIDQLCYETTPTELSQFVRMQDFVSIAKLAGLGTTWPQQIVQRLSPLSTLYELEILDKPPQPVIKVLTRSNPPKNIAVNQLSDGQKHTILLTIAMLAESNLPLVMDQPEDDLDNTFIFKSVVTTLREIKERRQVIVVTHNANIAVLGDSELLLPMKRVGDVGKVAQSGSIDKEETCNAVQDILEGGALAFKRRKEIYGI